VTHRVAKAALLPAVVVMLMLAVPTAWGHAGHPAPSTAFGVSCTNGHTYSPHISGTGRAAIPNLPAGTSCSVKRESAGPTKVSAEIPGGGVVTVNFAAPYLTVNPLDGPPGFTTTVTGTNFPSDAPVTLTWSVGAEPGMKVMTNAAGRFTAIVFVLPGDQLGPRQVRAKCAGLPTVTAPYLVVPRSLNPGSSALPPVFGR
jgi:hypothetical protein